jgi:isoleucyl-tRNA synthetase
VGASLDAKVVVAPPADAEKRAAFDASLAGLADTSQVIAPHGKDIADAVDDLRFLFLVSDVEVVDSSDAVCGVCADQHVVSSADSFTGATVGVVEASTARCARCWYHDSTVGSLANHPALCARCGDAVGDDV